jgi:hypothetical protein
MAGAGDELAAGTGNRNRLRASDGDREQVVEVLKAAFVKGRLTMDEFALRVTQAYASRTYADLDALTADIPVRLTEAQPPEPACEADRKKMIQRGTAVGATAGMVIPAVAITAAGGTPAFALVFGLQLSALMAVLLPGVLTLLSWILDRDSGRQLSQGSPPGADGKASVDLAGSPPQISPKSPHTADAMRSRRPSPRLPGLLASPGLRPGPGATAA